MPEPRRVRYISREQQRRYKLQDSRDKPDIPPRKAHTNYAWNLTEWAHLAERRREARYNANLVWALWDTQLHRGSCRIVPMVDYKWRLYELKEKGRWYV